MNDRTAPLAGIRACDSLSVVQEQTAVEDCDARSAAILHSVFAVDLVRPLRTACTDHSSYCNSSAHIAHASPMRLQCDRRPKATVDLGKTPEINVNPASAQRQSDGRR
jgi:hypothetical protein